MSSPIQPHPKSGGVKHLHVDEDQSGRRIDNLLLSLLGNVPKSHIYKLLRRGEIRLNGKRAKPETRVETNDILRLPPIHQEMLAANRPAGAGQRGEFLLSQILFENDSLLVINKPSGMAVHGGTSHAYGLIETLRNARTASETLELAHRLDRDTSGCLVIAKSMRALRVLHDQFRSGKIQKRYLLLAKGLWKGPARTFNYALRKDRRAGGEAVVRVDEEGKTAITHFDLQRQYAGCCLLSADLETGRTHQIRVHAQHGGFPIAGDEKYGDQAFNARLREAGLRRLFLHAAEISIPTEGGSDITVQAPLPEELQGVLNVLGMAAAPAPKPRHSRKRRHDR